MPRTTSDLVQGVLGDDYGPNVNGDLPDLTPYIASAYIVVNRVVVCASLKGWTLGTDEQELIERWLAAHFYAQSDKPEQSKSTEGASSTFTGQTTQGFDSTLYGQTAQRMDWSKCLQNFDKTQRASITWLGKPASQQIPIDERD